MRPCSYIAVYIKEGESSYKRRKEMTKNVAKRGTIKRRGWDEQIKWRL
jgi:hypothetical protein